MREKKEKLRGILFKAQIDLEKQQEARARQAQRKIEMKSNTKMKDLRTSLTKIRSKSRH